VANYNLCTIRPKGFLHSSAFDEVKSSLAWALSALGHEVMLTENAFSAGKQVNILFGSELLSPTSPIPENSILYNFEQPSHPRMEIVRRLAQGHRVWDYSLRNVERWRQDGFDVRHVPVGYTPNLTRIPKAPAQDIDVCFFGWLTDRRTKILRDLQSAGLKVYYSDSCYGGARDQILSRSKVCLNVHHDSRDMFEIVRVSYLMANSKAVVTETSSDDDDYPRLDGAMRWHKYESLVEGCKYLVTHPKERGELELYGSNQFVKQDYVTTVAAALEGGDAPETILSKRTTVATGGSPSGERVSVIQRRYGRGLREGDMIDFLPWLRSHARGNILEIGTRDGASTSAFLLGLEENDPSGHLTSVDIEDCSGLWKHPQWTFHRANSLAVEFSNLFPDASLDLALIDGNHAESAFIHDFYNCYHWVKPGGVILVHDIQPERGHEWYSVQLRERFFKLAEAFNLQYEILPGKYGMGVIHR